MNNCDLKKQKSEIRLKLKQNRAALPDQTRQLYSETISEQLLSLEEIMGARTVFIYISYASEVYTHNLIDRLLIQGKTLAVPNIINRNYMIASPFSTWDDLEPDSYGILTPITVQQQTGDFDVAITPGLGFTSTGHRMGFGRGYYDKWFANNNVQNKIALAFEKQLVDYLPIEDTDIPVDMIVTEKSVIRTKG